MEQKDNQFGLSQDNIEELRAEFISLGGTVKTLPEPSEVRDWTMVAIESRDASGVDTITLDLMVGGKWFHLNDYQVQPTGAYGGADQFDTVSAVAFTGVDEITQIVNDWTAEQLSHMKFKDGVFTIQKAGHYHIQWSMSFQSAGNQKNYEAGVCKNFVLGQKAVDQIQQGWAHRRIASAGDIGCMSSSALLELVAGDKISLGISNEDDTTGATIDHMSFTIFRIR